MQALRVLSVRQPWAWLIVTGQKDVENRSWSTTHRGQIAIHAGKTTDLAGFKFCAAHGIELPGQLTAGAVIGAVDLVEIVEDSGSMWAIEGCNHWLLADARVLGTSVAMTGRLQLFAASAAVTDAVMDPAGQVDQFGSHHDLGVQAPPLF